MEKMAIQDSKMVSIDYKLTDHTGKLLDSSKEGPLEYIHGSGQIIPGLEDALDGKCAGDSFTITIPPEEAYGSHDKALIQEIPRGELKGIKELKVGMVLNAESQDGMISVTVIEVTDTFVKLDANHPLAGMDLTFEVKVLSVREATAEEIKEGLHGHCNCGEC